MEKDHLSLQSVDEANCINVITETGTNNTGILSIFKLEVVPLVANFVWFSELFH